MTLRALPQFLVAALLAVSPLAPGQPSLRVIDPSPFTIRGSGFIAYEKVTITLQFGEQYVKAVTADRTGVFVVRFTSLSAGNCPAYIIRATGNRGSKAYLRSLQECMPLGPPP